MKPLALILLVVGMAHAQSAPPRKDIPAIAKAANGVIVSIITSDKDGRPVAQGTGFLVSKDGRIVTNYHVIKGASSAVVKLPDGAFYEVDGVMAFDKTRDLAIVKAHGQNFRVVSLGNSDRVQVGEGVVAIGSPLSLESTVSSGIVSGIRNIEDEGGKFLQITAPISPGSSGGPLFNMSGEVIGITTLYLKGGENLNFAIPINDVRRLLAADSRVRDFPNETQMEAPTIAGKILPRKLVCLNDVISTVEIPFMHLAQGCEFFVVQVPLLPEDARLLEGRSPEDDQLLESIEAQCMNAITFRGISTDLQSTTRSREEALRMIGAIWGAFQKNRDEFCSRHPTMYVLDMKLDGTTTSPIACSAPAKASN
jgi:hypothetical protein